jgi:hypothetical protein
VYWTVVDPMLPVRDLREAVDWRGGTSIMTPAG